MKSDPLISIVVPVYNVEKFLCTCLDSILSQTYTNWEAILVDDGSKDNSGKISDEYAQKDHRIKVLHKQNGGVSDARQAGLDAAKGEYIIHADPDDWVEPKMLEELLHKAKEENADMVICDTIWEKGTITELHIERPTSLDNEIILCDLFDGKIHGSCWNKLVRRSIFKQYNVKFPQGVQLREDLYVVASLLIHPIKVSYLNKAFYHYVIGENPNSLTWKVRHSYEHDVNVYNLFDKLTMGHICHKQANYRMASLLLNQEYIRKGGGSYYLFKRCLPYFRYIMMMPWQSQLRFYLSFIGFYNMMYKVSCRK